ncbi:MAG: YbaB/EbfC family nucleoid-associated protein [Chloroflexi bacterium]|nr:YbaB/EbfC family nucleoid-associated protein [Chloroflexota bacterium]MDE2702721.1 YbaB/EbfC family nucleoid-associated protein [Chloroflexota bacterium]MDE2862050.1 YbaB/EbfC family nucleoid-associated protein [Chloroflexota bacterium]MDE2936712.1 YbaB/EbfC family nucleoid-associated protein [Chloroflexota bacterium]MXW28666.1 YbaB/EbfC family nucleoid-associated protein [Chloroflexota bacterium]
MQMMRKMQRQMEKIQQELESTRIETSAGGGLVKVVINGQQDIESISISPDAVDPEDVELLEDLVLAAVNDAVGESRSVAARKMSALTGGMKIPGLSM